MKIIIIAMLKLISPTTSLYARKVLIVLSAKRIPVKLIAEVPWDSTIQTPKHNPLEKLPVLTLKNFSSVYESHYILEYIETKFLGKTLYPFSKYKREALRQESRSGCRRDV
jgi:glutathione S-transferase